MRLGCLFVIVLASLSSEAATKTHSVTFGKALPVKLLVGPAENTTLDITVRPLVVDGKVKEFTTGNPHDITDRQFVVRRAYRINDVLPDDPHKNARWLWERAGWLLVNRVSGKVSLVNLPDFDPFYSDVSWYRDYAAYCGITSSSVRVIAIVSEIGSKKPLFRKDLGPSSNGETTDSNCSAAQWERQPARVTFVPKRGDKFSVNVSGRFADEATDDESEER
jgi:hypothetical protein